MGTLFRVALTLSLGSSNGEPTVRTGHVKAMCSMLTASPVDATTGLIMDLCYEL